MVMPACRMKPLLIALATWSFVVPAAANVVSIDFDTAPASLPQSFYSSLGVTIGLINSNQGPFGNGTVSIVAAPAGLPSPASGKGITPYANLAGYMGSFDLSFSTAVDYFSMWAFDGPQAFTVQAFRFGSQVGTLNIPAHPSRLSVQLQFGAVGSVTRIDRIVINPVPGIGGSDPNRGPKYYDALTFNTIPAPAATLPLILTVLAVRRCRA